MAITGLRYSRGPFQTREEEPSSKFSKGDLLQYDSNSSLSRVNELFTSATTIAGVALADSQDSIAQADGVNRVPYLIPQSDTYFLSIATAANTLDTGDDVDFDVDGGGRPVVVDSQNSVRAVVVRGPEDIEGQSTLSQVEVGLIEHTGALAHS